MTRSPLLLGGIAAIAVMAPIAFANQAPRAPALAAMPAEIAALMADPAPAGRYVADPAHTSVTWNLDHLGLSRWTARFVGVDARLDWQPGHPETSVLVVEIPAKGVRTDFPAPQERDFDAVIAEDPAFLDGQAIRFSSERIEVTGPDTGLVHGLLTLRGETRPMTLDVTFNGSMAQHPMSGTPKIGFSAEGTIRRSDWGMDTLLPLIGDEVRISIETQLEPQRG